MASAVNASRPDVIGKLPQLQNMVKRDPDAYKTEFLMQLRHYESEYQLFLLQPSKESVHFGALISFLSHVAKCYPREMAEFPTQVMKLLQENYLVLEPDLRRTLVQSLMLMRNRNLIDAITLLKVFFELFRCPDKRLRELLYKHIVSDIRQLNATSKNEKVNKALQNFLFEMLQDENEHAALKSLQVLVDLFKRKVWHDQRTVNVIATACTSKNAKLLVMSLNFFLGIDDDILEDEEMQKKEKKTLVEVDYHSHSKKTRKRHRETVTAIKKNKRARKREIEFQATFPAIEMLNDPQGVVEKQFKVLKSCSERFEVKLLMMNFIGRVIGFHKLVLLPYYPLLQRYLQSHQQNVTQVLAYLVQSCHEDIPPEELLPLVKSIAHNFITERCTSEVIAVGINTVREIFRRVPLVLECEGMDVLITDLIMYAKSRDKSAVMAARGVLNLIREIHPALLKRKERGKFHDETAKPKRFGELVAAEGVDGVELLEEAEAAGRFDGEDNQDGWELASESEDDSDDEWVDVDSDDDGVDESKIKFNKDNELEEDDEEEEEEENDDDNGEEGGETNEEEDAEPVKRKQSERLDARRILTPRDFERIEMLKKEREAALKDPKSRSKKKAEEMAAKADSNSTKVNPEDLEGYSKRKRMTQEERLRSVLEGREDFQAKRSGGGTTNTEKKRLKHFMMIKKSKHVQSKVLVSARQVQSMKNKVVKKILKHDLKKRRKLYGAGVGITSSNLLGHLDSHQTQETLTHSTFFWKSAKSAGFQHFEVLIPIDPDTPATLVMRIHQSPRQPKRDIRVLASFALRGDRCSAVGDLRLLVICPGTLGRTAAHAGVDAADPGQHARLYRDASQKAAHMAHERVRATRGEALGRSRAQSRADHRGELGAGLSRRAQDPARDLRQGQAVRRGARRRLWRQHDPGTWRQVAPRAQSGEQPLHDEHDAHPDERRDRPDGHDCVRDPRQSRRRRRERRGEAPHGALHERHVRENRLWRRPRLPQARQPRVLLARQPREPRALPAHAGRRRPLETLPLAQHRPREAAQRHALDRRVHLRYCEPITKKQLPESSSARRDLVSLFMEHNPPEAFESPEAQMKGMRDMAITFLFADRSTTANSLNWLVVMLAQNPDVQDKIRAELRKKPPNLVDGIIQVPTKDQIGELTYLEATIRESLRLNPTIPIISRIAGQDTTLSDGTFVKQGAMVMLPLYAMGRMEYLWGVNVLEFKPERWIDSKTGTLVTVSPFKYVPFGGGPRVCLGKSFPLMETTMIAAALLSKFEFQTTKDPHVYAYQVLVALGVDGPLEIRLKRMVPKAF